MATTDPIRRASSRHRADLLSNTGAFVAGIGVAGVFLRDVLSPATALAILAAGGLVHALGMWLRHRLDVDAHMPRWARIAYWACWIAILLAAGWSLPLVTG